MNRAASLSMAQDLMKDFAAQTGLDPAGSRLKRYLWTDAFAVCNYLGFFETTGNTAYRDLALRLVDQVHHTLGRFRDDDPRTGWISGLSPAEGSLHPTAGGLRIGKILPERMPGEPIDEQQEWDRDGQYFHYLTKWMHALKCTSRVTGNKDYLLWAVELAYTANARFTFFPPGSRKKRMYWKMSVDLTRPLVFSMGQHDPLDGFVSYNELQVAAYKYPGDIPTKVLAAEIADIIGICKGMSMATDDPLGIGGLLCDALQVASVAGHGGPVYSSLLETVFDGALNGLEKVAGSGLLNAPARYRLAFRELGLSIGLAAFERLSLKIRENPALTKKKDSLEPAIQAILGYLPVREQIEGFWLEDANRKTETWKDHQEINGVMLATSLAPDGFLTG
ncbi:hypothetical protein [Methanoregula sp.]|uniref:hypothetical protein n=1 Tax=Methanoregula sp. TaxID=2052170 RepID=UPI003C332229